MSFVAVAIGGSALVGGATSIIAGNKAASAAKSASDSANATQMAMYNQTRQDQAPYRQVGYGALAKLAQIYGVNTGTTSGGGPGGTFGSTPDYAAYMKANPDLVADFQKNAAKFSQDPAAYGEYHWNKYGQFEGRSLPTTGGVSMDQGGSSDPYAGFTASPGYQFRLDQGMKAIERSAAARGGLRSGATMKALGDYAQGTASGEWGNYVSGLQSLAGVGQSSTNAVNSAGMSTANNVASNTLSAGNTRASAYANTGSAINQTVGNLASAYLYNKGYGSGGTTTTPAPSYIMNG